MADPEISTPAIEHEPPSLPASPLPKRTKVLDPEQDTPTGTTTTAIPGLAPTAAADTAHSGVLTPSPLDADYIDPIAATTVAASMDPLTALTTGDRLAMEESFAAAAAAPLLPDLEPPLQVKRLSERARAPTRGSAFAAGYDVYAARPATVPVRGRALVETEIAIAVPAGTYGRIAPRSGLAVKHGIDVGAGVIDADYRGPLKILLFNLGDADFEVQEGDRIAQLVIERIYTPEVIVVEELEETVRGAGGFGSTGGFAGLATLANGAPSI